MCVINVVCRCVQLLCAWTMQLCNSFLRGQYKIFSAQTPTMVTTCTTVSLSINGRFTVCVCGKFSHLFMVYCPNCIMCADYQLSLTFCSFVIIVANVVNLVVILFIKLLL